MGLLYIRDQLATIRDFIDCLTLACRGLENTTECSALATVCVAVREKTQEIDAAFGELIGGADPEPCGMCSAFALNVAARDPVGSIQRRNSHELTPRVTFTPH